VPYTNHLAPYAVIDPPPTQPALHGLLVSSPPVSTDGDRWLAGIAWDPVQCIGVTAQDPGNLATTDDALSSPLANPANLPLYIPFMLENGIARATWGFLQQDYPARPAKLLEDATSYGVEHEFWTGTLISDNAHLAASGVDVLNSGTALSTRRALAALEQEGAELTLGGRCMIHATPELVTLWNADGYLEEDGARLVTKTTGAIVVAGSGYPGTGPLGASNATPEAAHTWAYVTGLVQTRVSAVSVTPDKLEQAIDPGTNTITYRAYRHAAVIFDPCSGPTACYVSLGT
jgi:hypothetical protein